MYYLLETARKGVNEMYYHCASFTDVGKRGNNEDSFGLHQSGDSLFAIVADGLGGHENGEVASRLAVDSIIKDLSEAEIDEDALLYAILDANKAVCNANNIGKTTVAALWIKDQYAVAAHVGDSRIYQFRNGEIIFQSVDHSKVQMAVLVGELEPSAVRNHKDRNQLFRALGDPNEELKVDSTELNVLPGDRFLLCSDGFWEPVTEEDMIQTMKETDSPEQWLEAMKQIIVNADKPKQDNYTTVCLQVEQ